MIEQHKRGWIAIAVIQPLVLSLFHWMFPQGPFLYGIAGFFLLIVLILALNKRGEKSDDSGVIPLEFEEEPEIQEGVLLQAEEPLQESPIIQQAREDYQRIATITSEILQEIPEEIKLQFSQKQDNKEITNLTENSSAIQSNAQKAFEISDNLSGTAKQAFELSEQVQKGIGTVTLSLSESLKNTDQLFQHSKKIVKILELLRDISSKTHILSINASIVSARAGQAGKGFEVVAKEIRQLAHETEDSLTEIEDVINNLQETITAVIHNVEKANQETQSEKSSLVSVAGALQGVILAVEVIRTVSSLTQEKAQEQESLISAVTREEGPSIPDDVQKFQLKWPEIRSSINEIYQKSKEYRRD